MDHHHKLGHDSAIFSPSVARIAASTARDSSYVDAWLAAKFPGQPLPSFERNPDTLKPLLALASLNEAADEERLLLAKSDSAALQERVSAASTASAAGALSSLPTSLLDALEDHLPTEGHIALDALAEVAVQLNEAFPEPDVLGRRLAGLRAGLYEAEQAGDRIQILHRHIQDEASATESLLQQLQGDEFKAPAQLSKQNLDMQRRINIMSAQLPEEAQERLVTLPAASHPTVADLAGEEQQYLAILATKKELDLHLASFLGLPSDPNTARSELQDLRSHLRSATSQRDEVFEGLVERESPVKQRKR